MRTFLLLFMVGKLVLADRLVVGGGCVVSDCRLYSSREAACLGATWNYTCAYQRFRTVCNTPACPLPSAFGFQVWSSRVFCILVPCARCGGLTAMRFNLLPPVAGVVHLYWTVA